MASISILIPCFNEQNTIAPLLDRLSETDLPGEYEVVIIDDGSSDDTGGD